MQVQVLYGECEEQLKSKKFKWKSFEPKITHAKSLPLIVICHGFGDKPSSHDQFAKTLARAGALVLVPKLNLFGIFRSYRHKLRQANINAVVELIEFYLAKDDLQPGMTIDRDRICLVGHSAGGAVAFESSCLLQAHPEININALLLMDAVPWVSTILRSRNGELKYQTETLSETRDICSVCNLRCAPSGANAKGLMNHALAEGSDKFLEVMFPNAKHGDFVDEAFKSRIAKFIGLATTAEQRDNIKVVAVSFLTSALNLDIVKQIRRFKANDKSKVYTKALVAGDDFDFVFHLVNSSNVPKVNIAKVPMYIK